MNEFGRCLQDLDIQAAAELWPTIFPGSPLPNKGGLLTFLHHARTQADSIPFKLRAYSHRWLTERDLPSGLPDMLKPKAERIYPRIAEAVGVSVKAMSAASIPLARAMELAMSGAVEEAYANGNRDPEFVKARMQEARARVMRS